MADGIDIRLKRATYLDPTTDLPNETIANYRLLYGEALYLTDMNYLLVGRKGHIDYVENGTNIAKRIPATGDYTGEYAANGYVKNGFSVKELITAGAFFADWSNLRQVIEEYLIAHREPKTQTTTSDKIFVVGVNENKQDLLFDAGVYIKPGPVVDGTVDSAASVIMGAAWNDFAERRKCDAKPGDVVVEVGDGSLKLSSKRLQPGASIVSDTCGMIIGPEKAGYIPVAVAGRVLANYYGDKKALTPGAPVCTDEKGGVSIMTRNEIINYPECIVGYVSEIPTYKTWNHVKINDRIWIKVK